MDRKARENSLDYLKILEALMELPLQVGKNLLIDFLIGNYKNKSIAKNGLNKLNNFGSLNWNYDKAFYELNKLITAEMIKFTTSNYNKFIKILSLTDKGRSEIINPTLHKKNTIDSNFNKNKITETDKKSFQEFRNFLSGFNDEQKKAIISDDINLLCVAGAGTGKTTVLTKRIEFLIKNKNVNPSKILAITFTRKARQSMIKKLKKLGIHNVSVHTFNSFCENVLKNYGNKIYGRQIRVQNYGDKILAINIALASMGLDINDVINEYFNSIQKKFKTKNQMINNFMNDCFSVMDYFKVIKKGEYDFSKDVDSKNKKNAERIYKIVQYLKEYMMTQGLRDYSDQIIDTIKFLRENKENVPKFEHILVDEYQDVNAMQIDLLELLKSKNLFAVGDPRQSIFGWRGSDINYILNFKKNYNNANIIYLTKNYRSPKEIVDFMNDAISDVSLPGLEYNKLMNDKKRIKILNFENEDAERTFVIEEIINGDIPKKDIFVLARTNRQLMELSQLMKIKEIPHYIKEEDKEITINIEKKEKVTLATIHAIKGLEAKKVFVIGANEQNFPCKTPDNPAIEIIKTEKYDKGKEEKRLFYVAISRAKEILYITYSGKKPSYYIPNILR